MTDPRVAPDERFETLCRTFLTDPAVSRQTDDGPRRTGFGAAALKVDDRIFAMLVQGWLVVKLPQHRVDTLVTLGEGERYDPGGGRLMREWVTVGPQLAEPQWLALAHEARDFVSRRAA